MKGQVIKPVHLNPSRMAGAGVGTQMGSLFGVEARDGYLEEGIFKRALKDEENATSSRCGKKAFWTETSLGKR